MKGRSCPGRGFAVFRVLRRVFKSPETTETPVKSGDKIQGKREPRGRSPHSSFRLWEWSTDAPQACAFPEGRAGHRLSWAGALGRAARAWAERTPSEGKDSEKPPPRSGGRGVGTVRGTHGLAGPHPVLPQLSPSFSEPRERGSGRSEQLPPRATPRPPPQCPAPGGAKAALLGEGLFGDAVSGRPRPRRLRLSWTPVTCAGVWVRVPLGRVHV